MKRNRTAVVPILVVAVILAAAVVAIRAGTAKVLDPQAMTHQIAQVAERQYGSMNNVTCSPAAGVDPSAHAWWDCSGIDAWGDGLQWTANISSGHVTIPGGVHGFNPPS